MRQWSQLSGNETLLERELNLRGLVQFAEHSIYVDVPGERRSELSPCRYGLTPMAGVLQRLSPQFVDPGYAAEFKLQRWRDWEIDWNGSPIMRCRAQSPQMLGSISTTRNPTRYSALWRRDLGAPAAQNGLAAVAYGPSQVRAWVSRKTPILIDEQTDYPFAEEITLHLSPESPVEFDLHLRIPSWADGAQVRVNRKSIGHCEPGRFATSRVGGSVAIASSCDFRCGPASHAGIRIRSPSNGVPSFFPWTCRKAGESCAPGNDGGLGGVSRIAVELCIGRE